MALRISDLSDELLIKIISTLPTKVAVSTSLLSKQWQFLWTWLPKLEFCDYSIIDDPGSILRYREFINKNLPLHKSPVIESLLFRFCHRRLPQPENIKLWVGIAVSRFVRELSISYFFLNHDGPDAPLPSSLYTCNSLMTLKLEGPEIVLDVPPTVCLPSLKTLQLRRVTYANEDSLRLLLPHCPVLEDLCIERVGSEDNLRAIVVNVPSLQRLSLDVFQRSPGGYVIVTPSLQYFKVEDFSATFSCLIEHAPKLEEAEISVFQEFEELLKSIASVKLLSVLALWNSPEEPVYSVSTIFNQLEHLKLGIYSDNWSKLLVWLLRNSPKLRVLNLYVDKDPELEVYQPVTWSSVPECLLKTLETFEFKDYTATQEERDFLSFFFKHACCLTSTSIIHNVCDM
ncbi:unnamed protein product [Microthlaspi erraticum]|uniref:FBD domain-containing protein n=1 Tax=Microthlaspi erraticum TaxID=1685480 RepID=A0A6D2K476_9BRAS|nr:unnamed protein product [Microthlaspi erraticum]